MKLSQLLPGRFFRANKKKREGVIRTLEMVVAVIITLLFIIFVLPEQNKFKEQKSYIFRNFPYNEDFRSAVLNENYTLVRAFLEEIFNASAKNYNFSFIITKNQNLSLVFADKDVFSESLFIYNKTNSSKYKIIRIYYWKK
ncbi:MAG: hypothetical protein ACP5OZ_03205 [Candidatus Woesearchaeota archaeon]